MHLSSHRVWFIPSRTMGLEMPPSGGLPCFPRATGWWNSPLASKLVACTLWHRRIAIERFIRGDVVKAISLDGGVSFRANHQITPGSGQIPAVGYDHFLAPNYLAFRST